MAVTSSTIRSAWNTAVWSHATIQAMTTSIYNYDITQQSSKETDKFFFSQEINFFTYITTRRQVPTGGGLGANKQRMYEHDVLVRYYRQYDTTGSNFNAVIDNLESLENIVRTQLGTKWSDNVTFYRLMESGNQPELVELINQPVWLGTQLYRGIIQNAAA